MSAVVSAVLNAHKWARKLGHTWGGLSADVVADIARQKWTTYKTADAIDTYITYDGKDEWGHVIEPGPKGWGIKHPTPHPHDDMAFSHRTRTPRLRLLPPTPANGVPCTHRTSRTP